MRYKSFRIQNFKGIKDATIDLSTLTGAGVFALVGLNESGKTTILEAIHSFSPDSATSELVGGDSDSGVPYPERVPRHLISTFSGSVSVEARVVISATDRTAIKRAVESAGYNIDMDRLPNEIVFKRFQQFQSGDFQGAFLNLLTPVYISKGRSKKFLPAAGDDLQAVKMSIYNLTPDIAYFPTFVFDFPERIYLTDRGGAISRFYRRVFQDILEFDGHGHTIEKDVVRRVRAEGRVIPWAQFFAKWIGDDDRQKIQHVMDRAGSAVTKLVFGRWNRIFGEDVKGKEVLIPWEVVEGEVREKGVVKNTLEHDVYVQFQIRDGTRRFNVNDRSLGFRWFFSFMLFTQFRVARSASRPLLFLFDEPASNLHAAAQQKLIDSFPEIATQDHILVYTTHSHYMIEPKWLEQTYIVTNQADAPLGSVVDAVSLDDESLNIQVATYRSFVDKHPNQTSYFQPILDRLRVVPSRFDMMKASIILEGKSDYYILRYASKLLKLKDLPLVPALGAGTFDALASLHVGWNLNFVFVVDGDKAGEDELKRYTRQLGISAARVATISDFVPTISVIEDLLDDDARKVIQQALSLPKPPSKAQILRFFQEGLASDKVENLGQGFKKSARQLLDGLKARLAA